MLTQMPKIYVTQKTNLVREHRGGTDQRRL